MLAERYISGEIDNIPTDIYLSSVYIYIYIYIWTKDIYLVKLMIFYILIYFFTI